MPNIFSKINELNAYLKSRFFGIDRVIDEICDKIQSWYYAPEAMVRPQIINLWGMTGTGKSSICRDISEFLAKDLIQIDLGEYVGESTKNLGHNFFDKYFECSGKPVIILIDEFHIARTKDSDGEELDRKSIRSLWHLLSDGMLYIDDQYYTDSWDWVSYQIEDSIDEYNQAVDFVSRHKRPKGYNKLEVQRSQKNLRQSHRFFPRHFVSIVARALGISSKELIRNLDRNYLRECAHLLEKLENIAIQPKLDFTKSLIFVSGNLDSLYTGAKNFDPDVDLEILEKKAEDITVSDIKKELTGRFRLEQIGRLGNNHIIYPVLSCDAYHKIIEKDLKRIQVFYFKTHKLNLIFKDSVIDIVYKEGVFPNQGARSVLSTIGTLVESALANFFLHYKTKKISSPNIEISFKNKNFIFESGGERILVPIVLKIDELRKPVINQRSIITAVHEAGHVVTCILNVGVVPKRASIFTAATSGVSGIVEFLMSESNKTYTETFATYKNYIACMVAGLVAEKFIYGPENAGCGADSDLEKATSLAVELSDTLGYTEVTQKSRCEDRFPEAVLRTSKDESFVRRLMDKGEQTAREVIKKHKKFLLALADALLANSSIDQKTIETIMKKYKVCCAKTFDYVKAFNNSKK